MMCPLFILERSPRKPLRVAAFAAEGFGGSAAGEAVVDCFGAGGGEDLVKVGSEKISEGEVGIGIKAAWNDRPVYENTYLISQTVAEKVGVRITFGEVGIGPIEAFAPFEKYPCGKALTASAAKVAPLVRKGGV